MSQAVKEALEDKLDKYQQMKSVPQTYISKIECSIQESVYQVLSGQWLWKTFPGVANSNIPEKKYRNCREGKDISQLPEDSRDIFKKNMIDRYIDRPNLSFCGVNIQFWILFILLNFYDTIIWHLQNQNIMITSQKFL